MCLFHKWGPFKKEWAIVKNGKLIPVGNELPKNVNQSSVYHYASKTCLKCNKVEEYFGTTSVYGI